MARHWRGVLFDTGCRKPHGAAIGPERPTIWSAVLPRPGTLTMLPHGARMLAREQLVRLLLLRVGLRARGARHGRGDVHRAGQHAH